MQKRISLLVFSMLVLVLMGFQNCSAPSTISSSSMGTETGNPMSPADAASNVIDAVCLKISSCNPTITTNVCESQIQSSNEPAPSSTSVSQSSVVNCQMGVAALNCAGVNSALTGGVDAAANFIVSKVPACNGL